MYKKLKILNSAIDLQAFFSKIFKILQMQIKT